ncbi:MAG: class I SAM-dependent methyltransferase [Bacteroidia bacterium]
MTEASENNNCSICISSETEAIPVKEMRNGWREVHLYRFCRNCEYFELIELPVNIEKYYQQGYYTQHKPHIQIQGLRAAFWAARAKLYDSFLHPIWNSLAFNTILDWKHRTGISFSDPILDFGCGNGDILYEFHKHGFTKLKGLDPFLPEIKVELPFPIMKGGISELGNNDKYKLIMMHHSFEHMPDQDQVLNSLKPLLAKGGKLLIRMPIINEAFYQYREHWVQIDAPRHFSVHSLKSFNLLAKSLGYIVTEIFFDSTAFQFTGSEENKADISFFEPNSLKISRERSIFNETQLLEYDKKANEYNLSRKGDQAGFILELL